MISKVLDSGSRKVNSTDPQQIRSRKELYSYNDIVGDNQMWEQASFAVDSKGNLGLIGVTVILIAEAYLMLLPGKS